MHVVILAGGFGTRLSEETSIKPKPMVEIGGKPILWHIMKNFLVQGHNEFTICLGYKGYVIKEYFSNYFLHSNDVSFEFNNTSSPKYLRKNSENWKINLIDTGKNSMTGGRLKRISHIVKDKSFLMTYGDGVSDVNLKNLLDSHTKSNVMATVTAVQPQARFGALDIKDNGLVKNFDEKPKGDNTWINGGFFVLESKIFNEIDNDKTVLEQDVLKKLALDSQLNSYKHSGFWHPMDTLRDKNYLNDLWIKDKAPWKNWE